MKLYSVDIFEIGKPCWCGLRITVPSSFNPEEFDDLFRQQFGACVDSWDEQDFEDWEEDDIDLRLVDGPEEGDRTIEGDIPWDATRTS